jgi:single-strand DNA-binding protein
MSISYNRVIIAGNVTRDVDLRRTSGNTAVADVGLAINDRYKSKSGEWVDNTVFVDVTTWGRTAEVAEEYLEKGSAVLFEGRLKLDTWEQDGQKRSKLKVVAERMQLLGDRNPANKPISPQVDQRPSHQPPAGPQADGREYPTPPQQQPPGQPPGDDIPF